jgi:hypothetical protein
MNTDDREFEEFLRGFEPQRPKALPAIQAPRAEWRRWAAAAALVLVALGGSLWIAFRGPRSSALAHLRPASAESRVQPPPLPLNLSADLTRAALEHPDEFNAQMNAAAPRCLPRFDREDSSLRALSRE